MTEYFDPGIPKTLQAFTGLREAVWLWDTNLGRIIWANTPGLTFWGEHDLSRLKRRYFDRSMPAVSKMLALADKELPDDGVVDDFLFWTDKGPKRVECKCMQFSLDDNFRGLLLTSLSRNEFQEDAFPADILDHSIQASPEVDTTFETNLSSPEDQETLKEIAKLLADPENDDAEHSEGREEPDTEASKVHLNGVASNSALNETPGGISFDASPEALSGENTKDGDSREFFMKVSHEIRTPLNSIIGFADLMKEERFGELGHQKYKGYVEDILDSAHHALSLINDLLDISKMEAGEFHLAPTPLDLNMTIENCVSSLQPQTGQARLVIRQSLSQNLPKITADKRSIRQIVLNLLSNAIKFTAAGGQIIVSTQVESKGKIRMRVRDTGIGMSEEDLKTAMKPFGHSDNTMNGAIGTGLGLPLTKALTEANNATFDISSQEGKGTLVEITFSVDGEYLRSF